MHDAQTSLPPGTRGLPLLGETLSFVSDVFGFIHNRVAKHGPISRTFILGKNVALMTGPSATETFYNEQLIQRSGSFPENILELFGGKTARVLPVLDGAEHLSRKKLALQAFNPPAIAGYLPVLDASVAHAFKRWATMGEFGWQEELKVLAIEGVAACLFGYKPGPEALQLIERYRKVVAGFSGLPIPLPGTAFSKALKARDEILENFAELIRARQQQPTGDGLSLLLAAKGPNGESISPDALKLELHHVFLAGFIVYAALSGVAIALHQKPELHARLLAEIKNEAPEGILDPLRLRKMPLLLNTAMESKRVPEIVPITFGKVKKSFEFEGKHVPEGWLVFLAVTENNHNTSSFANAHAFDPDRFSAPRNEHTKPFTYVPQGAGAPEGHKCLGADFSTAFIQTFTFHLVKNHTFTFADQSWRLRRKQIPPEYVSGLRVVVRQNA